MPSLGISTELLGVHAKRTLSTQRGWIIAGLCGPLLIVLWTILHPFDLRQAYHRLVQCAIWLAAWNIVYPLGFALHIWLRPRSKDRDADLYHLPLSELHFQLKRWIDLTLLPFFVCALSLPLWFAVLAYTGVPYGQQWSQDEWRWTTSTSITTLWPIRIVAVSLAILSSQSLAAALVLWLDSTIARPSVRIGLLIFSVAAGYFGVARLMAGYLEWSGAYGPLIMCYRQTRGYEAVSFLVPLAGVFALALLGTMLPRIWRPWPAALLALLAASILLAPRLSPRDANLLRPVLDRVRLGDARQGIAYALGHLSPPRNLRFLFHSFSSNVLLAPSGSVFEPAYPTFTPNPELSEAENTALEEAAWKLYQVEMAEYERRVSALPSLPMWFGAVLYPLGLGLFAPLGLALGTALRRQPARDGI